MQFQLVQIVYWLALATWFGAVAFLAIAWPIVVRTLRQRNPVLPDVLSVNIDGQHGVLLSGEIISAVQAALSRIELGCAIALLLAFIGQFFVTDFRGEGITMILRAALYLGALGFYLYQWLSVWPAVQRFRTEFVENADDPEKANVAIERIGHYYQQAISALGIMFVLLLGLIIFSAGITPTHVILTSGGGR